MSGRVVNRGFGNDTAGTRRFMNRGIRGEMKRDSRGERRDLRKECYQLV